MNDRIIDLAEASCLVRCRNECLEFVGMEDAAASPHPIPLAQLAAVLLSSPRATVTQPTLARLAAHNVAVVVCDEKRLPVGVLQPLAAHTTQTEKIAAQTNLREPRRKRLWQALVQAKILGQALVIELLGHDARPVRSFAARVRSGDPENIEAQAARKYWPLVFGATTFRRDRDGSPPNNALNYGYAVLRAIVARALCGSGLHPSLGVCHHNRYDTFALASDVMEPFRPLVDFRVANLALQRELQVELDRDDRAHLLETFTMRYSDGSEERSLTDWVLRTSQMLTRCMVDRDADITVPVLRPGSV